MQCKYAKYVCVYIFIYLFIYITYITIQLLISYNHPPNPNYLSWMFFRRYLPPQFFQWSPFPVDLGLRPLHGAFPGIDQVLIPELGVYQWIGLRENLPETIVFIIKYRGFLEIFPSSNSMSLELGKSSNYGWVNVN